MKQFRSIILSVLLVLSLCACGQPAQTKAPETAPTVMPAAETPAPIEEIPAPVEETTFEAEEPDSSEDLLALAESFTDHEVSELIEAIGEPLDRAYVSSCLGSGEDGELYYDGFTVYTYREGDSEIVMGVE